MDCNDNILELLSSTSTDVQFIPKTFSSVHSPSSISPNISTSALGTCTRHRA